MSEVNYKCPCCGKGKINKEFDICKYCGWEYDTVQNNDIRFAGGANRLSLIEARYIYNKILEVHPKYMWVDDYKFLNAELRKFSIPPYKCKCCNGEEIKMLGDKCSKCDWIDSQVQNCYKDVTGLVNKESLNGQIKLYNNKRA